MTKASHLKTVGKSYRHFKLVKHLQIPELQCILREFIHEPTGAAIMHIANEDSENLFCLSFQTLPYNSNGVAHILEHTVLCGSEKFPVKDPFFAMNRRSLNTFMNALTGADFTCYPAASQVPKDFYNLLDVYLDAVFHPKINRLSFLQEGHRLEFAKPSDPSSPLEYKGIVYNEMKGALSSPNARLSEAINESLFPSITYGVNSGGDPKVIPTLTYEELKAFYQQFYHPSRCLFFFYGNMPLEGHLDFLAERILDQTQPASPLPPIPLQPRFKIPVHREMKYPIAPEEDDTDKTLMAFGWLTCHILEQEEALALNILEIILMDTDASPLKMALLRSGWCKQASAFIDMELSEIPWGVTLKGCQADKADELEKLLKETLREIAEKGIPTQLIENAIHQLEFYRSEITGDHAPFGLSLFMRSALLKQHGVDAEKGLMIHSLFDALRKRTVSEPRFWSDLIERQFLNNSHFIRIVMHPDKQLGAQEVEEEKKNLEAIKASLSQEQTQQIIDQAKELAAFQKKQEEEDIEILPKVNLSDIPAKARNYVLNREKAGKLEVFHHPVFTNDIVYADLVFDLPDMPEDDLSLLRLYTIILTQVGCNGRDYKANLEFIQGNTGGIGASVSLNLQAQDYNQFHPTFHIRGKALRRRATHLLPLLQDTLLSPDLTDIERLKEIISKHFINMEGRLNQSALKYAINLSASRLNVASKVANDLYGLNYYWKIREIAKDLDNQVPLLVDKLQQLQQQLAGLDHPHLVLSCEEKTYQELKKESFYGLEQLPTKPFIPWRGRYLLEDVAPQGRVIASPVAFIGKVFPTVSYTHPAAPALNIAAFLFDNLILHTRIREQGGAYGGGAVNNPMSGNFYFYSYRDPNISETMKAFEEAVQTVLKGKFDESDLEEAKLEMIQGLDAPISPGSRADLAYGWWRENRTFEMRQTFRHKLLALTKQNVIQAVEKELMPRLKQGTPVVFASKELLEKENQALQAKGLPPLAIESI